MYFLLNMGIFHCYVSLPKGSWVIPLFTKPVFWHHPKRCLALGFLKHQQYHQAKTKVFGNFGLVISRLSFARTFFFLSWAFSMSWHWQFFFPANKTLGKGGKLFVYDVFYDPRYTTQKIKIGRSHDTVDVQNPAPPRMMIISLFIGF